MSHESHTVAETIPQAMPFENAVDRRQKARIPCSGPVRLGPANQPVRSTLVLEDLSSGGLFIRCPRPVQVGARFSVELPLPNGETLYVPEVEVIYNRKVSEELQGFGGEFVNLPAEVEAKLIDVARFDSAIAPEDRDVSASMIIYQESALGHAARDGDLPRVSDLRLSTLRPVHDTEPRTVGVRVFDRGRKEDVSTLRVRKEKKSRVDAVWSELGEAPALDEAINLETTTGGFAGELELSASEAPRSRTPRMMRRHLRPAAFVAAGLAAFLGVGGFLFKSSKSQTMARAEAAPVETNGLSAETHSMLTGRASGGLAVKPAKATEAESKAEAPANPLPEPVDLEKLAAERQAQRVALVPAKAAKPAPSQVAAPAPKTTSEPAPRAATSAPIAAMKKDVDVRVRVSPGARIMRSFPLKAPARFVVDIAGQTTVPEVMIGQARVGNHEDYVRIVVDAESRAFKAGRAEMNGGWLDIQLME